MNKRTLSILAIGIVALLGVGLQQYLQHQFRPLPEAASAVPVRVSVRTASGPSVLPVQDSPTQMRLRGKDFLILFKRADDGAPWTMDFSFDNGHKVKAWIGIDGDRTEIDNLIFSHAEGHTLQAILPDEPREQLVDKASESLNFGEGVLGVYSVVRIDDSRLTEIIRLITERDRDADGNTPALHLKASVALRYAAGLPEIDYTILEGPSAPKRITFKWNGQKFVDGSGDYERLLRAFEP